MTLCKSNKNKNFSATEDALVEVSKLLTRLCKSRKAPMRLKEITELTGVVARLTRSLQLKDLAQEDDGYGDREFYGRILAMETPRNVVR